MHGAVLLVNGRPAVRTRSPAPRSEAALEIRDEADVIRGPHRGELESRILAGERAQASAPPDVTGTLRLLALAGDTARRLTAQRAERRASSEYAARLERQAQAEPEAGHQAEA